MAKADPHKVRDSLVADLVSASLQKTGERKGKEAEALVVPILEEMEHKYDPYRNTPSRANANEQLQAEAARQGIEGRVERFTPKHIMTPQQVDSECNRLLRKRIQWMKSKPDYLEKMGQIVARLKFGCITPLQADAQLKVLLDRSDVHVGSPWYEEKERLVFSG